jgi:hypothetical protein
VDIIDLCSLFVRGVSRVSVIVAKADWQKRDVNRQSFCLGGRDEDDISGG